MLSRYRAMDFVLQTVAGACAIALLPFVALVYPGLFPYPAYYELKAHNMMLLSEMLIILACGLLFYLQQPWLSARLMLACLLGHFIFLAWFTGSYDNPIDCISVFRASVFYHPWLRTLSVCFLRVLFRCGFPLVGLNASLIWMGYLRRVPGPKKTLLR